MLVLMIVAIHQLVASMKRLFVKIMMHARLIVVILLMDVSTPLLHVMITAFALRIIVTPSGDAGIRPPMNAMTMINAQWILVTLTKVVNTKT
jgi:hypothetical protein